MEMIMDLSNSFENMNYFVDSEESEDEDPTKPTKSKKKVYEVWKSFKTPVEFDQFWEAEKKNWRIDFKSELKDSECEYWTCEFSKKKKKGKLCLS